jgi:hypothetical protein
LIDRSILGALNSNKHSVPFKTGILQKKFQYNFTI